MLNAQWLETFTALSETGSMTRTAAALNMTQPGVSQHVKKLEAQLGTPLLRRDGRTHARDRTLNPRRPPCLVCWPSVHPRGVEHRPHETAICRLSL